MYRLLLSMPGLLILCAGCAKEERHFGGAVGEEAPVSVSAVVSSVDTYLDESFIVQGRIGSVCQTAGCWCVLHEGTDQLYVSLTSFTLPRKAAGESCRAAGRLIMRNERLTFLATGLDLLHE